MDGFIKPNKIIDENGKEKIISWRVAVSLGRNNETKKYDYVWKTVQDGRESVAKGALRQLLSDRDQGKLQKTSKDTLSGFLDQWLEDYVKPNLSPKTAEGYTLIIDKHIKKAPIGQIKLSKLKAADIQLYYTDKVKSGLSNRTVSHHHMALHGAMKHAIKLGLIQINPCDGTTPPKAKDVEMKVMTETDCHIFLEMARSTRYYSLFYLALFTGARRGELLALKWSDVDLGNKQLSVNRSLYQLADGTIDYKTPKTERSRRLISLSPSTVEVLSKELENQKAITEKADIKWDNDRLVFCELYGKPLLPNSVSHAWMKLARRCGLTGINLHCARHSMASLWLKMGIHPAIVAQRLGHSSVSVTLNTYSHILPGLQQSAADKFDDMLLPKKTDTKVKQLE